jgi:FlaG/FlaF family flagellin (archaellin)
MPFHKHMLIHPNTQAAMRRVITATALAVLIVLGAHFHTPIQSAYSLASSHHPETYTELYFDNVVKLPTRVTAGKPYNFSFEVVNHEAKAMSYHYQVTVQTNQTSRTLASGDLLLKADGVAKVPVPITVNQVNLLSTITVSLAAQHESISFRSQS